MSHVCILLATHNGARHLSAQLESIAAQTHADWSLWCGDDGSADDSRAIVSDFAAAYPEKDMRQFTGPCRGGAVNFLTLAVHADRPGSCLAFCDQDDVWMADRLERATAWLQGQPAEAGPAVYVSRTIHTDPDLAPRKPSPRHPRAPDFANALVQNILPGNTIVLNPAAAELLRRTAPAALAGQGVPFHDWWVYLLMSGAGARILQDDRPGLYYRQHDANVLGANQGAGKAVDRLKLLLGRDYADWIDRNLAALNAIAERLTPENRALLRRFTTWRTAPRRRGSLAGVGVWRQTRTGNLLLAALAGLGRL